MELSPEWAGVNFCQGESYEPFPKEGTIQNEVAKVLIENTDPDNDFAVNLVGKSSSRQSQGNLIWSDSDANLKATATQEGTASGSGECGKLVLNSNTKSLSFQRNVCNDENLRPLCMKTSKAQSRSKKKKRPRKKNLRWIQNRKMKKNIFAVKRREKSGGRQMSTNDTCECEPVDQCLGVLPVLPIIPIVISLFPGGQPPPPPPPSPPPPPANNPLTDLNPIENFQDFMQTYDKVYQNSDEMLRREQIFNRNNDLINVGGCNGGQLELSPVIIVESQHKIPGRN